MDKQHIIREIVRTAQENNDVPLGTKKFEKETGIKGSDWFGKYWAKWGDALEEAGFAPNKLQSAYDVDYLIEKLILLIREIKKFPAKGDIKLKVYKTKDFPSDKAFDRRLGTRAKRGEKVISYCASKSGYEDVIEICHKYNGSFSKENNVSTKDKDVEMGYVYLMKDRAYYKIGRSKNVERRNYEIGIKLPEDLKIVHKITTDDPLGIEAYWHNRFKDKRKQGEWFDLSSSDIKAFKRRKFM